MAKKIQGTVIVLILCLCGYLVYQMYGEDVIYLIKNKMERKEDNVLSMLQQLGKKQLLLVK